MDMNSLSSYDDFVVITTATVAATTIQHIQDDVNVD
jgi:hypothetical protein